MSNYRVTFMVDHVYEVEADSEEEAFDKAYREYHTMCTSSVAICDYDTYEVENLDEDDYDEEYDDEEN